MCKLQANASRISPQAKIFRKVSKVFLTTQADKRRLDCPQASLAAAIVAVSLL
jgi:hypothetical protein